MVGIGVLMYVEAERGSYAIAGAVSGSIAIAAAIGGPLSSRLIDKLGQQTVINFTQIELNPSLPALTFHFVIPKDKNIEISNSYIDYKNTPKEDVDLFALHQANKFMIDYLRKKCKIAFDKMPVVVDGIGNTGPATIPILLTESILESDKLNKVVLCGFGVGLSWGAVTCNLSNAKIIKTIEY